MGKIAKKIQLASNVDDNWNGFLARKRPHYLQASTAGENKAPAYFSGIFFRHIFRPNTYILIKICKQLKTRLLFKI